MEVPLIFVIFQRINQHYSLYICDLSCHSPDIPSLFLFSHSFPYGLYIGGSGGTSVEMEKLPEFNAEEDIEDWLEIFECRAACSKITNEKTKIQWCRSVIGGVGRRILKGLSERSSWEEAKQELRRYLSKGDSCAAAWKKLRGYKAKGKCFGEIASKVRELAVRADGEKDVRERLDVEAFLGAIPWPFAKEIRMKKIENLVEALEEARTRRAIKAEEEGRKRTVHAAAEGRPWLGRAKGG